MTTVIGIDPGGSSGSIAIVYDDVIGHAEHVNMPKTEKGIWDLVEEWVGYADVAYIESVHSFPGQGVSSGFKFGDNFGQLKMALTAAGIPWHLVSPQKWQKELGLVKAKKPSAKKKKLVKDMTKEEKRVHNAARAKDKTKKKQDCLALAERLFPDVKLTIKNSDSVLIAYYGLTTHVS